MTEKDIYRRLQEQLDQYSLGFPATESGVEIHILKAMFDPEEAALFTKLTAELETAGSVAQRLGRPAGEVAARLEAMAGKGLLFRRGLGPSAEYSAIPFVHGLVEFQINRLDRNTVRLIGRYISEKFKTSMAENAGAFLRTVPIGRSLDAAHCVAPFDDACEILKHEELIVVTDCACRRQKALFQKDCGRPMEVCFMFGPMGQYYLDNELGRRIGLQEALDILETARRAGLVTQPASAVKPFTMCNCCGDCCGFLRALNAHPGPAALVFSNYRAEADARGCSGCGICVERCQMGAALLAGEGVLHIDHDRCIGCGLCVVACPEEAVRLVAKSEEERRIPAADTPDQMNRLAGKRGLTSDDPSRIVSFGF